MKITPTPPSPVAGGGDKFLILRSYFIPPVPSVYQDQPVEGGGIRGIQGGGISYKMEWFYRLLQEPKGMWKRYATTNPVFVRMVMKEYFKKKWR